MLPHLTPQITSSSFFLQMLFLITGFMSCTITPRNYNTNLIDGNEISMTADLPDDLFSCKEGFQNPCAKRHKPGKVRLLHISQWQGAERAFKHYRKVFAAVIGWESIPILNVTSMDLPYHEGNPYLPFSDRLTKAGVYCPPSVFSLLSQNRLRALELSENGIFVRQEREDWQQTQTATVLTGSNLWRNDVITSPDGFPRGNFHRLPWAAVPAALNTVFQLIKWGTIFYMLFVVTA